jgi:pyruvate dehydrogenase E2 component (dihydrolipoamide acetyltransferase)
MFVCSEPRECAGHNKRGNYADRRGHAPDGRIDLRGHDHEVAEEARRQGPARRAALFEISTDKVDAEIPAPASGVLQEIKVSRRQHGSGQHGRWRDRGGQWRCGPCFRAGEDCRATASCPRPVCHKAGGIRLRRPHGRAVYGAPTTEDDSNSDVRSSPLVRKLAREHNVDLAKVSGTGTGGRVTKQDILDFVERQFASASPRARTQRLRTGPRQPSVTCGGRQSPAISSPCRRCGRSSRSA